MDDLATVLEKFVADGYTADFFARDGGLACAQCDDIVDPGRVVIEDVARLEGASDPDEEVIVYALSEGPCGRKGTYVVYFGHSTPSDDIAIEHALRDARPR